MWLKGFIIVHFVVLQNTISSQPLIENETAREARQTRYEECCPCPGISDGVSFRDEDILPSQKNSFFRMPLDECPCRPGSDNEGSSSIFYPSFLRGAQPTDRSQDVKQEPKPLLRPEVGLASSVLETLKEATDEEYKEALMRDATRTALKTTEPVFLDTEPGGSKNSVTIVINPRDLDNGYDAMPEASHVHQTRCIHSPLRSSNFENSRRIAYPRLSKEYLLLPKRKFKQTLHKSSIDMDNSPSNIQENFDVLNKNNLGNRLKMNPSLLSGISSKIDDHRNSWDNTGNKLRMMSPEQCDDLNRRTKLSNSPILTLAALKNKLRDLSESRNAKRLNDNLEADRQSRFNLIDTKRDNEALKLPVLKLPTFDTVIDKQSPLVKNILKLRDVELIPPRKTNINDVPKINHRYPDLKAARTENKDDVIMASKSLNEMSNNECDVVNRSIPDEFISKEPKETDRKSTTCDISTSSILQLDSQEDPEVNSINENSSPPNKSMGDETEMLDSSTEEKFQNNVKTDTPNEVFNIDDEQNPTADENTDSEAESSNILQQINQEDESTENDYLAGELNESDEDDCFKAKLSTVNPINLPTNMNDKVKSVSPVAGSQNSQRSSLKDDILRKLDNLRNTLKTKLAETEIDNFKETPLQSTPSTIVPNYRTISEEPVTTNDLQKLSDSLLNQEKLTKTNPAILKDTECIKNEINSENILNNNESYETSNVKVNDNESSSSEMPENKNFKFDSYDGIKTTLNPPINNDVTTLQSSEHTCNTVPNEMFDVQDEDISTKNEMASQASNIKFNAMRPQSSDSNLRSSLFQDLRSQEQPSGLINEKDFKKSFQVPSLEEIRQTISNIIDAGQQEEEDFRSIGSDTLNESSNNNLVQLSNANLRSKLPISGQTLLQSVQRNSLIPSLNTKSYKSRPELPHVASLKQLKLESMLNNRPGIFGNSLSMGKDKMVSLSKPKSHLNILGSSAKEMPTLDKIRDTLNTNTKNLFREVPFQFQKLPMGQSGGRPLNSLKNSIGSLNKNSVKTLQSNIKDITVKNPGILSKGKSDSNNIFETIARRREDMKEKLHALHIDFNDRLTSINDKLLDQTNLQSINMPIYRESVDTLNLPGIGCDEENNIHELVSGRQADKEPKFLLKSKLSSKPDSKFTSPKSLAPKDSKTFYSLRGNGDDEYIIKQSLDTLSSNPLLKANKLSQNMKKTEAQRNNLEKERGLFRPSNGHIKISFSSTTVTPVLKQKYTTGDYPKKLPVGILNQNNNQKKKNMVHSRFNAISNAYRTNINSEDSKHSPSELIPIKTQSIEKPFEKSNSKPRLIADHTILKNIANAKNTALAESVSPLAKENQFVTNIREALRLRLANITPSSITPTKAENDLKPFLDTVESPSESRKTVEVLTNPLKENTSYKCTMMCVRE